jgi:tRNA pseudouridine55 synthase
MINKISIIDSALSTGGTCDLLIECSKGTYIRSLARDIARSLGSVAHLSALRRTRVGPFALDEAYGAESLEPFIENGPNHKESAPKESIDGRGMESLLRAFTPDLARSVGLAPITIHSERYGDFSHGRPLETSWFMSGQDDCPNLDDGNPHPVFHRGFLIGMVRKVCDRLRYDFVSGNLP